MRGMWHVMLLCLSAATVVWILARAEPARGPHGVKDRLSHGGALSGGVELPPPWVYVDREPPWACLGPYDFLALGAVLAVRHHLAGKQSASAQEASAEKALLARYEIVNAYSLDMTAPGGIIHAGPDRPPRGYLVRAFLYWVELDARSLAPPTAALIARERYPEAKVDRAFVAGPRFKQVRIETVEYEVRPRQVSQRRKEGAIEYAIVSEWKVEDPPKVLDSVAVPVPEPNDVLAVWDPSTRPLE